jgi:hypothetical protein
LLADTAALDRSDTGRPPLKYDSEDERGRFMMLLMNSLIPEESLKEPAIEFKGSFIFSRI